MCMYEYAAHGIWGYTWIPFKLRESNSRFKLVAFDKKVYWAFK
jgi:hypothetical protein